MALSDHELKFIKKDRFSPAQPSVPQAPAPTPNVIDGLVALDLVTDVTGLSLNVIKGGVKLAHIILDKVTNWTLQGNQLLIYSEVPDLLTLIFTNPTEAQNGNDRFDTAMNGGTV